MDIEVKNVDLVLLRKQYEWLLGKVPILPTEEYSDELKGLLNLVEEMLDQGGNRV